MKKKEIVNDDYGYLVLYETNPNRIYGATQKFEAHLITNDQFENHKNEDFEFLKRFALEKMTKIFFIKATEPIVKIIPEVKVTLNK